MSFSVTDFNPSKPTLCLAGRDYDLSLITLYVNAKLTERFGKIDSVYDAIKSKPLELFRVVWILLEAKDAFEYNYEIFEKFVMVQNDTLNISKDMMSKINEAFSKSMPIIKNKKRHDDLMKIQAQSGEAKEVCYGVYYDKVSKRYGYSIDQFYNLTLRQLHAILTVINEQSYEDLEVQAALQGRKLKPRMTFNDIDEKEDAEQDEAAKELHARLLKEYQEKNKGK